MIFKTLLQEDDVQEQGQDMATQDFNFSRKYRFTQQNMHFVCNLLSYNFQITKHHGIYRPIFGSKWAQPINFTFLVFPYLLLYLCC